MTAEEIKQLEQATQNWMNTRKQVEPYTLDTTDPVPEQMAQIMGARDNQEKMYGPWNALNMIEAVAKLKTDYKIACDIIAADMVNELRKQEREAFHQTSEYKQTQMHRDIMTIRGENT